MKEGSQISATARRVIRQIELDQQRVVLAMRLKGLDLDANEHHANLCAEERLAVKSWHEPWLSLTDEQRPGSDWEHWRGTPWEQWRDRHLLTHPEDAEALTVVEKLRGRIIFDCTDELWQTIQNPWNVRLT